MSKKNDKATTAKELTLLPTTASPALGSIMTTTGNFSLTYNDNLPSLELPQESRIKELKYEEPLQTEDIMFTLESYSTKIEITKPITDKTAQNLRIFLTDNASSPTGSIKELILDITDLSPDGLIDLGYGLYYGTSITSFHFINRSSEKSGIIYGLQDRMGVEKLILDNVSFVSADPEELCRFLKNNKATFTSLSLFKHKFNDTEILSIQLAAALCPKIRGNIRLSKKELIDNQKEELIDNQKEEVPKKEGSETFTDSSKFLEISFSSYSSSSSSSLTSFGSWIREGNKEYKIIHPIFSPFGSPGGYNSGPISLKIIWRLVSPESNFPSTVVLGSDSSISGLITPPSNLPHSSGDFSSSSSPTKNGHVPIAIDNNISPDDTMRISNNTQAPNIIGEISSTSGEYNGIPVHED